MSIDNTIYYLVIPKGAKLPSADSIRENCLPKNMKIAFKIDGDNDQWNWLNFAAKSNEDNDLTVEIVKRDDVAGFEYVFDFCNIENILEEMPQQRAKKWLAAQLENCDCFIWFVLDAYHTKPFWKMTERMMEFICNRTGAQLLMNENGFLTPKGSYITIQKFWLSRNHLTLATLRETGEWLHWSYNPALNPTDNNKETPAVETEATDWILKYTYNVKEAFLSEDVSLAERFKETIPGMRIMLY